MHEFDFKFISGKDGLEKLMVKYLDTMHDVTHYPVDKILEFIDEIITNVNSRIYLSGQGTAPEIRA